MESRAKRALLPSGDELDPGVGPPGATPVQWLLLALGATWRRKWIALMVFLVGMGAATAFFKVRPQLWRVETKILAQRQALPSALRPAYDDQPTRSAWETVHRRENLLALARLPAMHLETRHPRTPLSAPGASPPDGIEDLVDQLDRSLMVEAGEGTITISLDWPDPEAAYDVVHAAVDNFLEARHVQEITAIDEVLSVLQGRAAVLRETLDAAIENARRRPARPSNVAVPRPRAPSEELVRLQSQLEAKQRAIRDVEQLRVRRLTEIQAQLDQARGTLSDAHPTVIGLRKDLEAASRESTQVELLRHEERKIRKEYLDRLAREGIPGTSAGFVPPVQLAPPPAPAPDDDQAVRQARADYEQMMARVTSAQVELDAARAAFKYRYNVIWPPQHPRVPVSPNPKKIFAAGLLLSLVLAIGTAVAPDLISRRVVERWQVERSLDLPVLGELRRRP